MTRRVFLSGPMTGHPDFNYPAFHKAGELLTAMGVDFLSPAHDVDGSPLDPPGESEAQAWEWYMALSIIKLMQCNEIMLLPRWEQSKGARLEHAIAQQLSMKISLTP